MNNFQKSLAVLKSLISDQDYSNISFESIQNQSVQSEVVSQQAITLDASSYLVLADSIPRQKQTLHRWQKSIEIFDTHDIKTFLNDIEDDPHLKADLISIHEVLEKLNLDPSFCVTTQAFKVEHLILCGTGDGQDALNLIRQIKPKILTILVAEWEDWISSFNNIDWLEIWNDYCLKKDHQISVSQSRHLDSVINNLVFNNILSLDHSYVYRSCTASEQTKEIYNKLMSGLADRVVAYTGFAMDEYNMFWNSSRSLLKQPRIFNLPYPSTPMGDYLVIGSGPSLEKHLDFIYENNDKFIVVACASNYGTLRKRGIRVDVLCLLERGEFMYEQYHQSVLNYGSNETLLFASVTSPASLHDLFVDTMVYFRPSLTPVSIYCDSPRQILLNEGPQSVNTGVTFALSQSPRSIILCGADFGTSDPKNPRVSNAIGVSPRIFDREEIGNLRDKVYTNDLLLDGVRVLNSIGYSLTESSSIKLLNLSDGVMISGWKPCAPNELSLNDQESAKERLNTWWHRQKRYSYKSFISNFNAANPRHHVFNLLSSLRGVLTNITTENWMEKRYHVIKLLTLRDNQSRYEQICPRMIRGNLFRFLIAINRQLIILAQENIQKQQAFLSAIEKVIHRRLDSYQREIFQLIDCIDSNQN